MCKSCENILLKTKEEQTMFNGDLKKDAIRRLNNSVEEYKDWIKTVQAGAAELFVLRMKSNEEVIKAEAYINKLANTTKEFDRFFTEYKTEFRTFRGQLEEVQTQSSDADFEFGTTVTAGVLAGVGTAAFAPTAAMAIATTFGAASTGTAIATLSGAAATNAALAWLGGGALVAGGGGIAAGEALLVLAGPVGWAIGGAALVGGGLFASKKNEKIANEADDKRHEVDREIRKLEATNQEVRKLISSTQECVDKVKNTLSRLKQLSSNMPSEALKNIDPARIKRPAEYDELIDNIKALSQLLNKKAVVN